MSLSLPTAALNHHSHVEIRCKTERRDMICRPASTGNLLSETSSAGRPNDKVDAKDDDWVCRGRQKKFPEEDHEYVHMYTV